MATGEQDYGYMKRHLERDTLIWHDAYASGVRDAKQQMNRCKSCRWITYYELDKSPWCECTHKEAFCFVQSFDPTELEEFGCIYHEKREQLTKGET